MNKRLKAAIISIFIPGGGQLYRKRIISGLVFLLIFFFSTLFLNKIWSGLNTHFVFVVISYIILWLGNIIDAYKGPYYIKAPCDIYCPAGLNPSVYVSLLTGSKINEAFIHLMKNVPFVGTLGRICTAPCEAPCSRSGIDESVKIRYLKRFIFDREISNSDEPGLSNDNNIDKSVVIIGGGISGCTCGYNLSQKGYNVVILEKEEKPGGIPYQCIPDYRLPRLVIEKEISMIRSKKLEIKTGINVGKDIEFNSLLKEFDSLYIATGSHLCKKLNIGEEKLKGVHYGLPFLKKVKSGIPPSIGRKTVVIGGGNVGIDAARTALRLGSHVILIALEKREEMPSTEEKKIKALNEGVEIKNCWGVLELIGVEKIEGVRLKACTSVFDEKGIFNPVYDLKKKDRESCDTMVICIGQRPEVDFLPDKIIDKNNNLIVNKNLMTPIPGVFAGGDILNPASVVEAIASGEKASYSIDVYLRGIKARIDRFLKFTEYPHPETIDKYPEKEEVLNIPIEGTIRDFREIEGECPYDDVLKEADRCLNCPVRFGNF